MMMDFPHPPEEQEALSNDEAHDQLGDLPFNGGMQITSAYMCTMGFSACVHVLPAQQCCAVHYPQPANSAEYVVSCCSARSKQAVPSTHCSH